MAELDLVRPLTFLHNTFMYLHASLIHPSFSFMPLHPGFTQDEDAGKDPTICVFFIKSTSVLTRAGHEKRSYILNQVILLNLTKVMKRQWKSNENFRFLPRKSNEKVMKK